MGILNYKLRTWEINFALESIEWIMYCICMHWVNLVNTCATLHTEYYIAFFSFLFTIFESERGDALITLNNIPVFIEGIYLSLF